ncbi:gamma-glutamyltranspeptidase [Pseudomassariella vexata]|uniref:Glutathione hydrolase n=1 Tax=Pseudomassariella vexata TaxID=1141098 RepID=A0A1Y2DL68_9PEZI|nr:gamma-glutamyltranspeptidase [Pseudomassariella vexata]ORY59961.1 gamma-glutamyltranspeptidase [Pseudomassariella vexata]
MKTLEVLPRGLLILLLAASNSLAAAPWLFESGGHVPDQQPLSVSGRHGAVACESKICSQIGIDLLARGGNAVDAYVGTQLCVGVTGMHHSGLGGGGFSLIRDKNGSYTVIDFREAAPAAAHQDMYQGNVIGSIFGGLAAAVPGELRGLEYAHKQFGRLPWKAVVHPSAYVARNGFPVTEDTVRYMENGIKYAGRNFLVEDASWAMDFAPNGKLVEFGDIMTRRRYADTLDAVADGGADVFYTGGIANATITAIQATNGTMTLDDLAEYKALVRRPLSVSYRGHRLFSSGAPSSGSVCLSTLKTMDGYDVEDTQDKNLTLHRFDEAMRFAYAAHQQLGDPEFVDTHSIEALEDLMLSPSGAAATRKHISDKTTHPVGYYLTHPHDFPEVYIPDSHGTSHIVTADADGMAVSSTTTVNLLYGNLIMVPETGVILNNEMNDFSIPGVPNEFGYAPSPANFIRAGKRPMSSITPVIVEYPNGTLYVTVGAAGGSRIISSTTQVAWRVLEHGMDMEHAIREPRIHDQLMPDIAQFEVTFDNATVASMSEKGHNVTWVREGVSAVQGIRVAQGVFEAVGETRQKNSGGLTV